MKLYQKQIDLKLLNCYGGRAQNSSGRANCELTHEPEEASDTITKYYDDDGNIIDIDRDFF